MDVRDAQPADLDRLARVWYDAWHEAHASIVPAALTRERTLASFRHRLEEVLPSVRVVGPPGDPIGFCMVKGDELHQLFVSARARGSGVAAALIADGEARLAESGVATAWLACAIGNERAARFYEKRGWRRVGTMVNQAETSSGSFPLEVWRYEKPLREGADTMTRASVHRPDPKLDLLLERVVDVPRELVWKAWTTPELIKKWFTPAPWTTVDCEIDLRPGGMFRTVMRSPEGREFPGVGCFLEVVEHEKLVWTSAMGPGYRPAAPSAEALFFTAVITLEPQGPGTKYSALAIHGTEADCKRHAAMGFHDGWGKALDQLVALVKTL